MTDRAWNPRYLEYCRSQGNTPEAQLEVDAKAWSGGKMAGFILWMKERRNEAVKQIPHAYIDSYGLVDHEAFDTWLRAKVDKMKEAP